MSNTFTEYSTNPDQVFQQDYLLTEIIQQQKLVNLYLINGIKLQGYLVGFDPYVFLLKASSSVLAKDNASPVQMVYKHAISTVLITEERMKN